jgi:alpha-N-acetylglucosamine transferase
MSRLNVRRSAVNNKRIYRHSYFIRFGLAATLLLSIIVFFAEQNLDLTPVPVATRNSIDGDIAPVDATDRTKRTTHHCLNDDFRPQNTVGVWTMLNDNMDYVKGAAKVGLGVRKTTKTPLDLVVMELKSKPLSEETWKILGPSGFIRCSVESIKAPAKTRGDLTEKFAVLHVWAMEVYETVVFLDADTFVQNSIDDLIHMDLKGKPLGVTKDIRGGKWVETFNSGVMVLHPTLKEHERLVELLYSGLQFEFIMSDQGFLNEVYKENWHEIGFVNNANLALYKFKREFWNEHKSEDINVIHYTMQKPWKCKPKGPYGPICTLWINAFANDN